MKSTIFQPYLDLDGNPVSRPKNEYPYSYDFFVTWKNNYKKGNSQNVYSDRLAQLDRERFDSCCSLVWGNTIQHFFKRTPKDIENFLCLYYDKKIKLTAILEGCNIANGYPIWCFYFDSEF